VNEVDLAMADGEAPDWLGACRRFVEAVLEALGIHDWEVSILFCNDRFSAALNERYRGVKAPTDVLSFAQLAPEIAAAEGRGPAPAGDIVISLETMKRNARENYEPEEMELKRLLIHGILHLRGMDHSAEGDSEMMGIQERILSSLASLPIF